MDAVSAEDRKIMGTPEAAKAAMIAKAREWRETRQPLMAPAAEQRKRTIRDQQLRFELANAVLLWLWHEENPT